MNQKETPQRRYVNPKTDIGFKMIFGQKDLMKSFLEALFQKEIEDLEYLQQEQIPDFSNLKTCVFDIFCKAKDGRHFIIEMQIAFNMNFKDRMLYYMCKAITRQIQKGQEWRLCPVYGIFFTDFIIDKHRKSLNGDAEKDIAEEQNKFIRSVSLRYDDTFQKFHDKVNMIFIEMPKFAKREEDCETLLDKWILNVTNMADNKRIAFAENEEIFRKLSESSIMDQLSPEAQLAHEMYLDNLLQFKWAFDDMDKIIEEKKEEVHKKDREIEEKERVIEEKEKEIEEKEREIEEKEKEIEGQKREIEKISIKTARNLKELGVDIETIAKGTGLSIHEIEAL